MKQFKNISNKLRSAKKSNPFSGYLFLGFGVVLLLYFFRGFIKSTIGQLTGAFSVDDNPDKNHKNYGGIITSQAKQWAQQLYEMLENGVEFETILKFCKGFTGSELTKIYDAFGKRQDFAIGDKHDLFTWFQDEISDWVLPWIDEKTDLQKLREVWDKSNVPISF